MCLGMLRNLFWFSFSCAEYSTILVFVTYNAYQMQIQTSCLHSHVVLFLFKIGLRLRFVVRFFLKRDLRESYGVIIRMTRHVLYNEGFYCFVVVIVDSAEITATRRLLPLHLPSPADRKPRNPTTVSQLSYLSSQVIYFLDISFAECKGFV